MAKLVLNNITSGYATHTLQNSNNDLIEAALENTLSRDGTTPNTMGVDLDMNNHRVINLAAPSHVNDAARLQDVQNAVVNGVPNSAIIPFIQAGTGAVERTVQDKNRDIVSVKDFGAIGDGVTDDTVAIQAAFDYYISLGNTNKVSHTLVIPSGTYIVTTLHAGYIAAFGGSAATKDIYYKKIECHGHLIGTNATGPVLDLEGMLGVDFINLRVTNSSTNIGSSAVRAKRSYAVSWEGCHFFGGETAHILQGNNNTYYSCGFSNSGTGFYLGDNTADCLNNILIGCDLETNTKYGVNLNRTSGTLPSLSVKSCYFESNVSGYLADIRLCNSTQHIIDDNYFAIGTSHDVIVFAGTISPTNPEDTGIEITKNIVSYTTGLLSSNFMALEVGTATTAMRFAKYKDNILTGNVGANTLLGVKIVYPGSVNSAYHYGIDLTSKNYRYNIVNSDFSTLSGGAGSSPTSWANGAGTAITSGVTISPNGYGNKLLKPDGNASQFIVPKSNTLYELSAYAKVGLGTQIAQLDIWGATIVTNLARSSTSSLIPVYLRTYYFNPTHTNGTAAGATTNSMGYAIGSTTILIAAAGTGTILAGDSIQFAGDTNQYIVKTGTANVSIGGNIVLFTPLVVAIPAAATAVTIQVADIINPINILLRAGGTAGNNIEFSEIKMIELN